MKTFIIIFIIWIACGFYSFGTTMAYFNWMDKNEWPLLHNTSRDHLGTAVFEATLGPMGAIATCVLSNFNQHGWELWEKP